MRHVWVVARSSSESHLVLGVFGTPYEAINYLRQTGLDAADRFDPPRPGRQVWYLVHGIYTYTIEQHVLREGIVAMECNKVVTYPSPTSERDMW